MRQVKFSAVICQAVEGGNRAGFLSQHQKLQDTFIYDLIKSLKLVPLQAVLFVWALSKSTYQLVVSESIARLAKLLPEIVDDVGTVQMLSETSDELLQGLVLTIAFNNDLSSAKVSGVLLSMLARLTDRSNGIFGPLIAHVTNNQNSNISSDIIRLLRSVASGNSGSANAAPRRRVSLADLLIDLGYQCSATVDIFKRLLYLLKITEQTIEDAQIAEIIVAILPQTPRERGGSDGAVKPEHIPIYQQIKETPEDVAAMDATKEWNLDTVVEVLKQFVVARQALAASGATTTISGNPNSPGSPPVPVPIQPIQWNVLVRSLDHPLLRIKSEMEFQIIIKILLRLTGGKPISAEGLIRGVWNNKTAQIALLMLSTNVSRNFVDFSSLVSPEQILNDPTNTIQQPQNYSWMAIPVYQTLMELAASGMNVQVLEVLSVAANIYPEYVTIGLAQVQDPSSGVRTEILKRTLPLFTGVSSVLTTPATATSPATTQTTPARPTSTLVMKRLYEVNNLDMLVLLCRFALKKVTNAAELHETDMRFRSFPNNVVRKRLDDESSVEELFAYWCLLNDKGELNNFEEKLKSLAEKNSAVVRQYFLFCAANVKTMRRSASSYATTTTGGLLSFNNFSIFVRVLSLFPNLVPSDQLKTLVAEGQQSMMSQSNPNNSHQNLPPKPPSHEYQSGGGVGGAGNGDISTGFSNASGVGAGASGPAMDELFSGSSAAGGSTGDIAADIEKDANAYFQQIYSSDMSVKDVMTLLKQFKNSNNPREQEIFRCMIHNIFDEYRFFHNYPDRELQMTGRLFGTLIQHQLIAAITLGIALRYVLEALRKDPDVKQPQPSGNTSAGTPPLPADYNEKMFRFGIIALEQFRGRLNEWPQYCSHLMQIPHLRKLYPDIYADIQRTLGGNGPSPGGSGNVSASTPVMNAAPSTTMSVANSLSNMNLHASPSMSSLPATHTNSVDGGDANNNSTSTIIQTMVKVNVEVPNSIMPPESIRDKIHFIINNIAKDNVETKCVDLKDVMNPDYFNWFANYLVVKRISTQPNLHAVYIAVLDYLSHPLLGKTIMNSTFHNVTKLLQSPKIQSSSSERSLLRNLGIWIGQMTLAKNKVLLHRNLDLKELLLWGYETGRLIAVCSFVVKIVEGAKDSKIFKLPNPWMVGLLGVFRELNELDDLKMNIKFEIQVLYKSLNIKMEEVPKTNVLNARKSPVKSANNPDFSMKNVIAANANAANNVHTTATPNHASSSPMMASSGVGSNSMSGPLPPSEQSNGNNSNSNAQAVNIAALLQEQTVIPNLAQYVVVNSNIQAFHNNASYRKLLALAVDKAIREIILPVVERTVSVATVTTKTLIPKDFMFEPNENVVKNASHVMVSNLAGSLAVISCREPLRVSISNHLRSMFTPLLLHAGNTNSSNPPSPENVALLEQIVQLCANDNVELGCVLIEKAATEKSIREVDLSLASMVQARRKARESTAVPPPLFYDPVNNSNVSSKYYKDLPDYLKSKPNGTPVLTPEQLAVYEVGFLKSTGSRTAHGTGASINPVGTGVSPSLTSTPSSATATPSMPSLNSGANVPTPPGGFLNMQQAMEAYQHLFMRLDGALKAVQQQVLSRGISMDQISLSMLGGEHEIVSILREISFISSKTQVANNVRSDSACNVFENIFKRLVETAHTSDILRVETMIAILEALKEGCNSNTNNKDGPPKTARDILSWLLQLACSPTFNISDETWRNRHKLVLIYLLKAGLLPPTSIDEYFSQSMDGGRNLIVVELALTIVKHCVIENIATTYDFAKVFDSVSRMNPSNPNVRKQLQKWLTDLKALSAAKEEEKKLGGGAGPRSGSSPALNPAAMASMTSGTPLPPADSSSHLIAKEHVVTLLERWLAIWSSNSDQFYSQYLQVIQQFGALKTEESADRFFRLATEICVEACLKTAKPSASGQSQHPVQLTLTVMDALAKLFLLLIRVADKEASASNAASGTPSPATIENSISIRANILLRILSSVTRVLTDAHNKGQSQSQTSGTVPFDQRPFHRLLLNLVNELGPSEPKVEQSLVFIPLLTVYTKAFLTIGPDTAPGFAFGWLNIISHPNFMPHLLLSKERKGWPLMHKLLMTLLLFLKPFLQNIQMNDAIRRLYKETLRVLLVLLHDFPEFLSDHYNSFCDVIPSTCVQLRNLVLSAFPSTMRLPDPFTPNLKIESLAEISLVPRISNDYSHMFNNNIMFKNKLDAYLTNAGKNQDFLNAAQWLSVLSNTNNNAKIPFSACNGPMMTAVIMHIGSFGANQLKTIIAASKPITVSGMSSYHLIKFLVSNVVPDAEFRYCLLNTIVNQLRYPNIHTYFFSNVFLQLFLDLNEEYSRNTNNSSGDILLIQEQIVRVFLERLIVHRPHPVSIVMKSYCSYRSIGLHY